MSACTCYEAGRDPLCPVHGQTAGDIGSAAQGHDEVVYTRENPCRGCRELPPAHPVRRQVEEGSAAANAAMPSMKLPLPQGESAAATPSWPERVIVDGREVPVVIDPMLPDHVGVAEWNLDFQGNPTTPKRIVLRAREERVLLHEVLHCLLGDNEALVRRATLLYDLGWRLSRV